MFSVVEEYKKGEINKEKLPESFQGWNAYAKWATSYNLRKSVLRRIFKSSQVII
jgi:hypothetical protein